MSEVVAFGGAIVTDPSKPDGTPRKLMSADRLSAMGWQPQIPLRAGIETTYGWLLSQEACDLSATQKAT